MLDTFTTFTALACLGSEAACSVLLLAPFFLADVPVVVATSARLGAVAALRAGLAVACLDGIGRVSGCVCGQGDESLPQPNPGQNFQPAKVNKIHE